MVSGLVSGSDLGAWNRIQIWVLGGVGFEFGLFQVSGGFVFRFGFGFELSGSSSIWVVLGSDSSGFGFEVSDSGGFRIEF